MNVPVAGLIVVMMNDRSHRMHLLAATPSIDANHTPAAPHCLTGRAGRPRDSQAADRKWPALNCANASQRTRLRLVPSVACPPAP